MLNLGFRKFKPNFNIHQVLTFYHLTFGEKGVRVLDLHIWDHLLEALKAKLSLQTFERSLNDCQVG